MKNASLWAGASAFLLAVDLLFGPIIQFPTLFVIPVALATSRSGRRAGIAIAIILSLSRLYFRSAIDPPWTVTVSVINAGLRLFVLVLIVLVVDSMQRRLVLAMELQVLKNLLPICAFCKKIRDQRNVWQSIGSYQSEGGGPDFTPVVCPECSVARYGGSVESP